MTQITAFHNPFRSLRYSTALMTAAAFLFSLSTAVLAEDVVLKSMKSPVYIKRVKSTTDKWYVAKAGIKLSNGDSIKTGARGSAELMMEDGSRLHLRAKTQLVLMTIAPNRVINLSFGRLKSIVSKLKNNRKFEVKTPIAAASVRGTIFEVGYDDEKKNGFLDVSRGLVALDQDDKEVMVPAGQRVDFMEGQPLTEPVQHASNGDDHSAVRHEVGLGMSKEDVMAAAAEEMRLAEYQEGKTLIDVNGKRVRLEEYIIRKPREVDVADQDKAFKFVVLNDRDDRFDYFYYRGIFNTTLPTDLSVALQDVNGKLGTTQPTYFLKEYEMGQSNTKDSIKDNASGGHLVKIDFDGTNYTLTDPDNPSNTRTVSMDEQSVVDGVTYHKIYDPINDRFQTLTDAQYTAGDFRPAVYNPSNDNYQFFSSGDTYWRTRYNNYSHLLDDVAKQSYAKKSTSLNVLASDLDADFTYAGGYVIPSVDTPDGADQLHNRVTLYYGDGTTETVDTYIISDDGKIGPVSAFDGVTSGAAYKTELLKWNYEQVTTATEFGGRKIDLVVEPKILIKSGLIK